MPAKDRKAPEGTLTSTLIIYLPYAYMYQYNIASSLEVDVFCVASLLFSCMFVFFSHRSIGQC